MPDLTTCMRMLAQDVCLAGYSTDLSNSLLSSILLARLVLQITKWRSPTWICHALEKAIAWLECVTCCKLWRPGRYQLGTAILSFVKTSKLSGTFEGHVVFLTCTEVRPNQ